MTPARKANDIPHWHPLLQRSNATHARMTDTFSFPDSFAKQSRGKRCGMSQNGSRARFRAAVFGELTSQILVSCSSLLRVSGGVQCVQYSAGRRPAPEKPADRFRNQRSLSTKFNKSKAISRTELSAASTAIASSLQTLRALPGRQKPKATSRTSQDSMRAHVGAGLQKIPSRRPKHSESSLLRSCVA